MVRMMESEDSVIGAALRSRVSGLRQAGEGEYVCAMDFDPAFRGFEGHFEGNPIVPGVCLIEATRVVAETVLERQLSTQRVAQCRFRRPVRAGERAEVKIKIGEAEPEAWLVQADIRVEEAVCAQLRLKAVAS